MPNDTITVPLDTPGATTIVRPGNVINGLSVFRAPAGAQYFIKLGNNNQAGPFDGKTTWVFGPGTPQRDLDRGVQVVNEVAQPGLEIRLLVSFATGTDQ